jgi:hypothetical protein
VTTNGLIILSLIEFTLEIGGSSINFLDLSITPRNGSHQRLTLIFSDKWFVISYPSPYKHTPFYSMIHRLVSIPLSPSHPRKKLDTIIHKAKTNDIKSDIEKLCNSQKTYLSDSRCYHFPPSRKKKKKNEKIGPGFLTLLALPLKSFVYWDPSIFVLHFIL